MTADLDPQLRERLRVGFEEIPAPSGLVPPRRQGQRTGRLLAGLVVALMIIGATVVVVAPESAAAILVRGCPVTDLTTWHPTTGGFPDPYPVRVGGRLAGMAYLNRLGPGDYWYVQGKSPADAIELSAYRLDVPAASVEFRAEGFVIGAGLPTDWVPGWYYRTEVGGPELTTGCWKVTLRDDRSSAVIFAVRDTSGPHSQ